MRIFDAHAHLQEVKDTIPLQESNNEDRQLPDYIVCNATRPQEWDRIIKACRFDKRLLPALGIHPWYITADFMLYLNRLSQYTNELHAIGETGLDRLHSNFELQKASFSEHLRLADRSGLTLVVHCVKAFDELYAILKEKKPDTAIVIHGYNKSKQLARQLCNVCDCYFSLSPAFFTQQSDISEEKRQLLDYLILSNRILLETDIHFAYNTEMEALEGYQNVIHNSLKVTAIVNKNDIAAVSADIFELSCRLFKAD